MSLLRARLRLQGRPASPPAPPLSAHRATLRVRGGVDLLQGADCDLRVNLRRLDVLVAKHLLDVTDVGSILVHQRGHRVAEEMA